MSATDTKTTEKPTSEPDFDGWTCPLPLRDYPTIVLGHGGGGKLTGELVEHLFLPAFRNDSLENLGDSSVVEQCHGDGLYINTAGIGVVPEQVNIGLAQAQPGDAIHVSGTIADHGMAIMSVREGLQFEAVITSDTAALNGLVQMMLDSCPDVHVLRDPTRGEVAASLNEIATASNIDMMLEDQHIPVNSPLQSACEILGLDPLFVANEGKLIAIVPAGAADALLTAMRAHPLGLRATQIGHVTADHPNFVVARTTIGATRVITTAIGEQLPRIC